MGNQEHWETIYRQKGPSEVSWYRPHLEHSLRFIKESGVGTTGEIIDIGGGTSTLVDDLIGHGYQNVTVLDLSAGAIDRAKDRLGPRAAEASWIVGDVTEISLPRHRFDFWHDRAVFHFLIDEDSRHRYVEAVRHALKPNGHIVVATFGLAGPERCSGLPVVRYSADGIHSQFGSDFRKVGAERELHHTPWGAVQEFVYCYCRMTLHRQG